MAHDQSVDPPAAARWWSRKIAVGAAFMAYAPVTGVLAVFGFGALMLARIQVEERALDVCAR